MKNQFDMDYSLDLFDGIKFVFGVSDFSNGEKASHDCPGEDPYIEFHYLITFDAIHDIEDMEGLGHEIELLYQKDDSYLQGLMEAKYKSVNEL